MPADRLLHPRCGHSEKVTALSSEAYRVWTQYLLSADDFGVMVRSPVKLQADNYWLERCQPHRVAGWLEDVIACELVAPFAHQGRQFVCQLDWQRWQKVQYPRATIHPKPDDAVVERCDESTRKLFDKHPGGQFPKRLGKHLESTSPSTSPSTSLSTSLSASPSIREVLSTPRETANANGLRLPATGSEGGLGETTPPFDAERGLAMLQEAYPQQRVTYGYKTETAWIEQLGPDPAVTCATMQAHLENHKRSYEWRVKGMIPALDKWLREGLWQRTLDDTAPAAPVSRDPQWVQDARARKAAKAAGTA